MSPPDRLWLGWGTLARLLQKGRCSHLRSSGLIADHALQYPVKRHFGAEADK